MWLPRLWLIGSSILIATQVTAAVTLRDCINWGEHRNPEIRKIELEVALDRPGKRAAIGQFLPTVAVGFGINKSSFYNPTYINSDGRVSTYPVTTLRYDTYIDALGYIRADTSSIRLETLPVPEGRRYAATSYLRIEETLYDGGRNYYTYKNALLTLAARRSRIDEAKRLNRNSITKAYATASLASRQHELASRMTTQRKLQLEFARARLATGSVTRRDVLQAEVDLGRAVSDSMRASLGFDRALEELNRQIGLPLDTTFELSVIPPPKLSTFSIEELEISALENRSDSRIWKNQFEQKSNDIRLQRAGFRPRLTAGLTHDRSERSGTTEAFTLNPRNKNTTIDLSLSWVVFDQFSRDLSLQRAKVEHKKSEIDLTELKAEIRREIRAAAQALKSNSLQLEVAVANAELAGQTLEFEQERYRLGSATQLELNAAQLSFYQAETEKLQVETEYIKSFADLEAAIGMPLRER